MCLFLSLLCLLSFFSVFSGHNHCNLFHVNWLPSSYFRKQADTPFSISLYVLCYFSCKCSVGVVNKVVGFFVLVLKGP